jgi:dTDP-4-dehydrorhamnose reductase
LDITDAAAVDNRVDETRPGVIINAAAYTAVDRAEEEPHRAFAVNRDGVAHLAQAARDSGAALIHVSTDFVFDGTKSRPYLTADKPNPQGAYGASKLAGEVAVREAMGGRALIIRTAWVYSAHGNNFVKTMLRLMNSRDGVRVVDDQIGSPTWACGLARFIVHAAERGLRGIYHWTDAGTASWYDFAVAIREEALALGLLSRKVPIRPITTEEFPTPAKRPSYSVLDKSASRGICALDAQHWRESLRQMLSELAHA